MLSQYPEGKLAQRSARRRCGGEEAPAVLQRGIARAQRAQSAIYTSEGTSREEEGIERCDENADWPARFTTHNSEARGSAGPRAHAVVSGDTRRCRSTTNRQHPTRRRTPRPRGARAVRPSRRRKTRGNRGRRARARRAAAEATQRPGPFQSGRLRTGAYTQVEQLGEGGSAQETERQGGGRTSVSRVRPPSSIGPVAHGGLDAGRNTRPQCVCLR